ncbi:hypothetical protein THAOC_08678, partial [Thalassiosira oceanica]
MTNAASDVELELPGSGDGGRTDSFHGKNAQYEKREDREMRLLSSSGGRVRNPRFMGFSAALYQKLTKSEESQEANGFEARSAKSAWPWVGRDPEP